MRHAASILLVIAGFACAAMAHGDEAFHFQTGQFATQTPPADGRLENGLTQRGSNIEASNLNPFYVDLRTDDEAVPVRKIWQKEFDEEMSARARFSEKTHRPPILSKLVFAAAFQTPQGRIIISATSTIATDCQSYERVGLSPKLMTCPMKVALMDGDNYKIIYSTDSYAFATSVDADGTLPAGRNENTVLVLRPDEKTLSTSLLSREALASLDTSYRDPLSSDDTSIELKY